MSIDRYLAIVHPLSSIRYRTIQNAWVVCVVTWMACTVIMTPYWMYARTSPQRDGTISCRMFWPRSDNLAYEWFWTNFQVRNITQIFFLYNQSCTLISVTVSGHIEYKKRRVSYRIKDKTSCQNNLIKFSLT